jgi:hypothetical protein
MNSKLKNILMLIVTAFFAIGIDILLFNSTAGLNFLAAKGKFILYVIAAVNVFVGGALAAGFLSKDLKIGFKLWFRKPYGKEFRHKINAAYGFGVLIFLWNLFMISQTEV